MKKTATILCLLLAFAATASAQQLEKLFNKYMEDERFNYIYQRSESTGQLLKDWDEYLQNSSLTHLGKQMLMLQSAATSLEDSFTREVGNALKADKFEQTSLVRNGKNRVETYEKRVGNRLSKVSFIKNPGNVMITWEEYEFKKKK